MCVCLRQLPCPMSQCCTEKQRVSRKPATRFPVHLLPPPTPPPPLLLSFSVYFPRPPLFPSAPFVFSFRSCDVLTSEPLRAAFVHKHLKLDSYTAVLSIPFKRPSASHLNRPTGMKWNRKYICMFLLKINIVFSWKYKCLSLANEECLHFYVPATRSQFRKRGLTLTLFAVHFLTTRLWPQWAFKSNLSLQVYRATFLLSSRSLRAAVMADSNPVSTQLQGHKHALDMQVH